MEKSSDLITRYFSCPFCGANLTYFSWSWVKSHIHKCDKTKRSLSVAIAVCEAAGYYCVSPDERNAKKEAE